MNKRFVHSMHQDEHLNSLNEHTGYRHLRLESLMRDELNELFRNEISDPALVDLLVQHVELSVDYRHARVHLTALGLADRKPHVEKALARAKHFVRARIYEAIELKRLPDLRFIVTCASSWQE